MHAYKEYLYAGVFAAGVSLCVHCTKSGQRPLLCSFSLTHILRFCSLGEMGPHSVVTCIAELQENSNTKQMSTQTKWSLETQQSREQWRKPEKGKEERNRKTDVIQ